MGRNYKKLPSRNRITRNDLYNKVYATVKKCNISSYEKQHVLRMVIHKIEEE